MWWFSVIEEENMEKKKLGRKGEDWEVLARSLTKRWHLTTSTTVDTEREKGVREMGTERESRKRDKMKKKRGEDCRWS